MNYTGMRMSKHILKVSFLFVLALVMTLGLYLFILEPPKILDILQIDPNIFNSSVSFGIVYILLFDVFVLGVESIKT